MHYLLFYDVVEGYAERRIPFRAAHLEYAQQAVARNELILGGALANPVDRAVLLFRGSSPAVAEQFAKDDPYVKNGLVKKWYVREWTTVIGPEAEISLLL
jgi:uncharacterized protein YciI